jgi:hypothetical protein
MSMVDSRRWLAVGVALSLGWPLGGPDRVSAADSLVWHAQDSRIDAQLESWDLPRLLENLAAATGWEILVEPGTTRSVSARFKNLNVRDALRDLLGNLNYALLPQTNAPPKLFVYQSSVQDATQPIRPVAKAKTRSRTGRPIPNELIVTLKGGSRKGIEELARQLGARVLGRMDGLNAYRLQFPDEAAANAARELLTTDSDVAAMDQNFPVERPTRVDGLEFSSASPPSVKAKPASDGSRVVIGLIDTPVQPQGSGLADFLLPAVHLAGEAEPGSGVPTHGTSMAETILQGLDVALKSSDGTTARILPIDVYGRNSSTTTFEVAAGINAAISAGANPINLSLGSDGDSPFLHKVIAQAHEQGVVFFAAAGNEPTAAPTYPAAYPEVIAVTAGDRRGNIAPYANYGSFVDVVAPGTSIIRFASDTYLVSGTSASTAYVSGMAAGLASESGKPVQDVETKIRKSLGVSATSKAGGNP